MRDLNILKRQPGGIRNLPCVRRVEKLPVPMRAHFATEEDLERADFPYSRGRIITDETAEGDPGVAFRPGDAIMTGSKGESWPIAREKFFATYEGSGGTVPEQDGAYVKRALPVLAVRVDEPFTVDATWGRLTGRPGDWLVQYDEAGQDFGIISADAFEATYRILGEGPDA